MNSTDPRTVDRDGHPMITREPADRVERAVCRHDRRPIARRTDRGPQAKWFHDDLHQAEPLILDATTDTLPEVTVMAETAITIVFDPDHLTNCTDSFLATLWHVAQANPAPYGDRAAGEVAEKIGREIIRRWLGDVPPELHQHSGRDHGRLARPVDARLPDYEPGGPSGSPEWSGFAWTPKKPDDATNSEVSS